MQFRTFSLPMAIFAASVEASFGPAFSTGPVVDNATWIRESVSTLIVPDTPNPPTGNMVLWVGMATSTNDLIQSLALTWGSSYANYDDGPCANLGNNWCTLSSTFRPYSNNGSSAQFNSQKQAAATPGAQITMHYKFNDDTEMYDQNLSLNGKVVSSLSTLSGYAQGWGTAVECVTDPICSSIPAHSWINTKIILDQPNPAYDQTVERRLSGVTGNIQTSDGGKTWTSAEIGIPASDLPSVHS